MGLNSLAVTRFSGGVNNRPENDIWGGSMPFPDPTIFHIFDEDFDYFLASDWTITETQAGATQALAAGNGGLMLLTNSAADDDINQIQKVPAAFLPVFNTGKRLFMKAIFQLSDVLQSDFAIGIQLANVNGTDLAVATDGIFFLKVDGAATIAFFVRQANVAANSVDSGAIATLVNATNVEVSCFYDGGDRVYFAVNNAVLGFVTVSSAIFPNVVLAPVVSLRNGEAVAKTATVDKLYFAQER